jgi:hypothetical protein
MATRKMTVQVNTTKTTNFTKIIKIILEELAEGDVVRASSVSDYLKFEMNISCSYQQTGTLLTLLAEMGFFTVIYATMDNSDNVSRCYTRTRKVNDIF